jgi:hypothetical protein
VISHSYPLNIFAYLAEIYFLPIKTNKSTKPAIIKTDVESTLTLPEVFVKSLVLELVNEGLIKGEVGLALCVKFGEIVGALTLDILEVTVAGIARLVVGGTTVVGVFTITGDETNIDGTILPED